PAVPEKESLQDRIWRLWTDPFTLLEAGIYGTMLLGLMATVLAVVVRRNSSVLGIAEGLLAQVFYMLLGVLLLVALRAIAENIGSVKAAPSGGAEDEKKPESTTAVAEKPADEKPAADETEPAPAWSQNLIA